MPSDERLALDQLPEAQPEERGAVLRGEWGVWLLPLAALFIALWVGYRAWIDAGVTVTVLFPSASGIEAGKTRVRYKEVEVGRVTAVELDPQLDQVEVTLAIHRDVAAHLKEDARFWVVRPRVTARAVTGLETLLSGTYITFDPGCNGKRLARYSGLKDPPFLAAEGGGKHFVLTSERAAPLEVGTPLYFRGLPVGEVVGAALDEVGTLRISIFVRTPYDRYVRVSSRFWVQRAVRVEVGGRGIVAEVSSGLALLQGGIAFDWLPPWGDGEVAEEGQLFPLYADERVAAHPPSPFRLVFRMRLPEGVSGLYAQTPVFFSGFEVGQVLGVMPRFDEKAERVVPEVWFEIWPDRLDLPHDEEKVKAIFAEWVQSGLRAQPKPMSLLTGQKMIDLVFAPKAAPATLAWEEGYPTFPALPAAFDEVARTVTQLATDLRDAPWKDLVSELRDAAHGLRVLLDAQDPKSAAQRLRSVLDRTDRLLAEFHQAPTEIVATLAQLRASLAALEGLVNGLATDWGESGVAREQLHAVLRSTQSAARSVELLADELSRHPESLLRGRPR
ncbi:MlaD family protein [Hydrogenophilus islandicus]